MQTQILLMRGAELLHHCESIGNPLPISQSVLEKDRLKNNKNPLGIPFRKIGGGIFYDPNSVLAFFAGQPIIQPERPVLKEKTGGLKRGKPSKIESIEARKRGLTVPQLRALKGGAAC